MASAKGGIFQGVEEVESGWDTGVKGIVVTVMTRGVQVHKRGHRGEMVKWDREVGGSGTVATRAVGKGAERTGSLNRAPGGATISGVWSQDR